LDFFLSQKTFFRIFRFWKCGYEKIGDPARIEKVFVAETARKREKTANSAHLNTFLGQ
jgi:hypothetical protein